MQVKLLNFHNLMPFFWMDAFKSTQAQACGLVKTSLWLSCYDLGIFIPPNSPKTCTWPQLLSQVLVYSKHEHKHERVLGET
jgi:hypothetical protein